VEHLQKNNNTRVGRKNLLEEIDSVKKSKPEIFRKKSPFWGGWGELAAFLQPPVDNGDTT
jgi:hypothetical protein